MAWMDPRLATSREEQLMRELCCRRMRSVAPVLVRTALDPRRETQGRPEPPRKRAKKAAGADGPPLRAAEPCAP